jgi:hypothetical protein
MQSNNCLQCPFYAKPEDVEDGISGTCNEPRAVCDLIELTACPLVQYPMRKFIISAAGITYIIPMVTGKNSHYFRDTTGKWTFTRGDLLINDDILETMKIESEKRNII